MALSRFRVARTIDRYVVLDHGPADDEGVYSQDGDPEDPDTVTEIAFTSEGLTAGDKAEARMAAIRLNETES